MSSVPTVIRNSQQSTYSLLGNPESVLKPEFLDTTKQYDVLPFKGKLNLPNREQVVKLYLYQRKLPGNYRVSKERVAQLVAADICTCWKMANFDTIKKQNIEKKIVREFEEYQNINKNKRDTDRERAVKEKYREDVKKIFDIASKDLVDRLKKQDEL